VREVSGYVREVSGYVREMCMRLRSEMAAK
jgi:hypothetical protein